MSPSWKLVHKSEWQGATVAHKMQQYLSGFDADVERSRLIKQVKIWGLALTEHDVDTFASGQVMSKEVAWASTLSQ